MGHHSHQARTPQEQRLHRRKAQILPWIADPLKHFLHNEHEHDDHGAETPSTLHDDRAIGKHGETVGSANEKRLKKELEEEIEAEEATPIELFYDLFFVANLTTITSVHFMTSTNTVYSYIQFFILLWFTWIQTTFYDVRFSVDSVYERIIKAIHFAVMFGFSSVSTQWNPMDPSDGEAVKSLKVMTLTLMVSRLALGIQYLIVMFFSKRHRKGTAALGIHSATMFVSGIVNLGLFFTFATGKSNNKSFIAWYGMIVVEVVAVVATSSIMKVVSFKTTHLVERLGLLTLIIIGEGIIVMCKAVNSVEKGFGWNVDIFGIIAAAGLMLYFFWMYYFDYTPAHSHYGTIRQQLWAVLHFPFHLAVVLSVEGLRQFTTFYSFMQALTQLVNSIPLFSNDGQEIVSEEDALKSLDIMQKAIDKIYYKAVSKQITEWYAFIVDDFVDLRSIAPSEWTEAQSEKLYDNFYDLSIGFAEDYGIKMPKLSDDEHIDAQFPLERPLGVFDLVFRYFHIALGVVFVMYGVFGLMVRRGKDVWDYISVALRFLVALVLFSILAITNHEERYVEYLLSSWPVPATCIIMFIPLVFDKIVAFFAFKRAKAVVHN